jgi:hypothetical protein
MTDEVWEARMNPVPCNSSSCERMAASSIPPMAASAPDQNTRPATAASWISALSSGGSMSRRAAMSAFSACGNGIFASGKSRMPRR